MAANSRGTAKKTRGRGKPFEKGDPRINREGRRRIPDDVRVAFISLWPYAVDRLQRIITDGKDDVLALKAAQIILDRVCGSVPEKGFISQLRHWSYQSCEDDDNREAAYAAAVESIDEIAERNPALVLSPANAAEEVLID